MNKMLKPYWRVCILSSMDIEDIIENIEEIVEDIVERLLSV